MAACSVRLATCREGEEQLAKRKYGVDMQIVSYQDERPCSEIEASLVLCRYYVGVQVAVMAAKVAVEADKGEIYWREREWRMVKARRKRVLAAEEKAAADAKQAARENETASEREVRKRFHSQTRGAGASAGAGASTGASAGLAGAGASASASSGAGGGAAWQRVYNLEGDGGYGGGSSSQRSSGARTRANGVTG